MLLGVHDFPILEDEPDIQTASCWRAWYIRTVVSDQWRGVPERGWRGARRGAGAGVGRPLADEEIPAAVQGAMWMPG